MTNITIIGMGMIGTSLGMALRSATNTASSLGTIHITGYDQDQKVCRIARDRLAIDTYAHNLEDAVAQAHVVVVATPVQAIRHLFAALTPMLAPDTIVTDVASTKSQIYTWAQEMLPSHVHFIGGHPMAGKEKAGPEAGDAELFRNAIYCLTPAPTASQHSLDLMEAIVATIGAKHYYIDPQEHDAYVAGISHLPFLLSTILVEATSRSAGWKEMALLAASGFRDVTRLASGDVIMHRDICMTNRDALIRWINDTVAILLETREALEQDDTDSIEALFARAQEVRDEWLATSPRLRPGEIAPGSLQNMERPNLFGFRSRKK